VSHAHEHNQVVVVVGQVLSLVNVRVHHLHRDPGVRGRPV